MKLTVSVKNAAGETLASATGEGRVFLEYKAAYQPGDVVCLASDEAGYVVAQLEDSLPETFGRLNAEARLPIPFEERRICYSPKAFVGEEHLIWARCATEAEISARRNLALNPLDCHANQGLFPRYAGGRYALDGDTTMIVSRGLARESTRIPRLFNRPELVVVDIVPEAGRNNR